jgi:hypothetical protein
LQSLFVIKNDGSNEINFIESGILNVDVAQKVEIYIQEMEVLGFLDFRTFLQIFKNAIKPLVDIASTANTDSKSHGASYNDSLNDSSSSLADTISGEQKIIIPKSVFELFAILGEISRTSIQVAHDGLSLFVINDLYRQPVTIARIVCSVLKINAVLNPSDRRVGIIRRNGSIEFNVEDSDNRYYKAHLVISIFIIDFIFLGHTSLHQLVLIVFSTLQLMAKKYQNLVYLSSPF